jgi:hypothetical protein
LLPLSKLWIWRAKKGVIHRELMYNIVDAVAIVQWLHKCMHVTKYKMCRWWCYVHVGDIYSFQKWNRLSSTLLKLWISTLIPFKYEWVIYSCRRNVSNRQAVCIHIAFSEKFRIQFCFSLAILLKRPPSTVRKLW